MAPPPEPIAEETAPVVDKPIDLDSLGSRAKEVILQTGAVTWTELAQWTKADVDELGGCGPATLSDLQALLGARGLAFAEEEAEEEYEPEA